MKKIALSLAALALSAGAAVAADLPSRKAAPILPPPPPPPMWTGFYVGLNAGGTWANSSSIQTIGAPLFANPGIANSGAIANGLALSANAWQSGNGNGGFIGGGQIGYNWQFFNNLVTGVETDIQGVAASSGATNTSAVAALDAFGAPAGSTYSGFSSGSRNLDYIGTVRGRLGWLFTPTLMVYGTGGVAYGGASMNASYLGVSSLGGPAAFASTSFADTRTGWTAGGGVEWMFMPNWSAKVEYLYYDLGQVSMNNIVTQPDALGAVVASAATQTTARFNGNIVRAGVNYHFNWGAAAPVVAKY